MKKQKSGTRRYEDACRCLKGIAHPVRLAILCELRKGPVSVGALAERVGGVSQSNLSQHLAKMQGCGILRSVRQGAQIFYEAADARIFECIDVLNRIFCRQ